MSLKIVELFAGIGSQAKALQRQNIAHEVVGISEWDVNAIVSYDAIHTDDGIDYTKNMSKEDILEELKDFTFSTDGKKPCDTNRINNKKLRQLYNANKRSKNLGDITKINNMPNADLWTYSFPCFKAGTLILTSNGYKPIEEIKENDMVMTHNNRFKRVVMPMVNYANHIYKLSTMCSEDLYVTEEHPFYVREKYKIWNNEKRSYDRKFKKPKWVNCKDLNKDFYVGVAINQESKLPDWKGSIFTWVDGRKDRYSKKLKPLMDKEDFWYVIGRYMGDGWIRTQGGVIICDSEDKIPEITDRLDRLDLNYSISKERTVVKIHIAIKELGEYCEQFGKGACNKKITSDILNLPVNLIKAFVDGYIESDGCFTQNRFKISTVSRELVYGVGQCVAKAYKTPFSIYKTKRKATTTIEGREVKQKDTYTITFKKEIKKQDKAFYDNGYIWCPINNKLKEEYNGFVYNMEVEDDNSYTVQNIIVHNCQDLSVAGKMKGLGEGTRSGLLYEVERLLEIKKSQNELPSTLLLENVKNLVGKQFKSDFENWIARLDELGYNTYWEVINAKNCGIPQNRERVFGVSILKSIDKCDFKFAEPFDNGIRLKDILENEVDEKYYINGDRAEKLLEQLSMSKEKTLVSYNRKDGIKKEIDIAHSLNASDYRGINRNQDQNAVVQIGTLNGHQSGHVYGIDGVSVNLCANGGGMGAKTGLYVTDEPKIFQAVGDRGNHTYSIKDHSFTIPANPMSDRGQMVLEPNECIQSHKLNCDKYRKMNEMSRRVYSEEGIAPTIHTCPGGNTEPKVSIANEIVRLNNPKHSQQRVYDIEGISPTISAGNSGGGKEPVKHFTSDYRIRKLTPKECWRLMGFDDEDIDKCIAKGISNSQLYRQAGNSIVVKCLELIFKSLFKNA